MTAKMVSNCFFNLDCSGHARSGKDSCKQETFKLFGILEFQFEYLIESPKIQYSQARFTLASMAYQVNAVV